MWKFQVINHSNQSIRVVFEAKVENGTGVSYQAKSDPVELKSGLTRFDHRSRLGNIRTLMLSPLFIQRQGEFPEGNFTICLEAFRYATQEKLASSCQPVLVSPMTPPYLVTPFNKEILEQMVPTFSWTPPAPLKPDQQVHYRINIVQIQGFQSPQVAIRSNPSFYRQEGISTNVMPYPATALRFEKTASYAWQIEAFDKTNSLGKSEVWSFSFAQPTEAEKKANPYPYGELERKLRGGGFYLAPGIVKFKFEAGFGEIQPDWCIKNAQQEVIELYDVSLEKKASNLYALHVPEHAGLEAEKLYTLEVKDGSGDVYKMRFLYRTSQDAE